MHLLQEETKQALGRLVLRLVKFNWTGYLLTLKESCNLIDYETWSGLKENNIDCQSTKSEKKLFACGQKESVEVARTFVSEIVCEGSGEKCRDEFKVIKGAGKLCLGRVQQKSLKCWMLVLCMEPKFGRLQQKEVIQIFAQSTRIY